MRHRTSQIKSEFPNKNELQCVTDHYNNKFYTTIINQTQPKISKQLS